MPDTSTSPATKLPRRPPPEGDSGPVLFVMRQPGTMRDFRWEIRRLSAIVLERSRIGFATAELARVDGQAALRAIIEDGTATVRQA